jgi:Ca2+-binding EF-hand superfamily protein
MFDKDKTGYIEANEILLILDGATNVSMIAIVAEVDSNKDGKVSFEEFKTMMNNKAENRNL